MYDAWVFLFALHFLCYPRFSYRRYKTEKYISLPHTNLTSIAKTDKEKIACVLQKKQSTHVHILHTHTTSRPFRKKIKCTHINRMQTERDALRVIKYQHRYRSTHTGTCRLVSGRDDVQSLIREHSHTEIVEENFLCVGKMLFLAATSREEFHSEYLAVKTARSQNILKF